ncbi:hypothetical protein QBC39DRAFT_8126 [Podospora conica]|nr:hypothetical protein QBC39DRAFT_8126 [Schizothecium conicum]
MLSSAVVALWITGCPSRAALSQGRARRLMACRLMRLDGVEDGISESIKSSRDYQTKNTMSPQPVPDWTCWSTARGILSLLFCSYKYDEIAAGRYLSLYLSLLNQTTCSILPQPEWNLPGPAVPAGVIEIYEPQYGSNKIRRINFNALDRDRKIAYHTSERLRGLLRRQFSLI